MLGTIGEVRMFAGNFAPKNWAFCNGQLMAISSNTALFSIIGCEYGGDCRTTFMLPDMRGRSCLQQGMGPGLTMRKLASKGGQQTVSLTLANLPMHNHFMAGTVTVTSAQRALNDEGTVEDPNGAYPASFGENAFATNQDGNMAQAVATVTNTLSGSSTGNGQSFDIHSPYLGMHYIICLTGIFPSRS